MADTILTLAQLNKLFYDLTVAMVGGTSIADVRQSWPTYGAPALEVTNNVAFLKIYDVESPITAQREMIYSQIESPSAPNMEMNYTRTLKVDWIFYGPDSWDWANLVQNKLFYQIYHDMLALQNLYLIPGFKPPMRVPELWSGEWYERIDLSANFNELMKINDALPYIETVEIDVIDHSGVVAKINIEE